MSADQSHKFATRVIHGGQSVESTTGAVSVPIFATSTYAQAEPGKPLKSSYARGYNPTRAALEAALANLEGGSAAFAFGSGLAASGAILDLLPVNAHIIASDDLYGGTVRLFTKIREQTTGLQVSYVDLADITAVEAAIRPNTRLLWVETPTNPLLKIADLARLGAFARKHNLISVVDNTFATPWAQRPLEYGFDLVIHSITKYIGGHSDLIGGAVITGENGEIRDRIKFIQNAVGAILGPFDSFLALRGIKTLDVRMQRHSSSAQKIAEWLEAHDLVEKVFYPGLPSHEGHAVAKAQMRGFGGVLSARLKLDLAGSSKFLSACRVFTLAESLGGVESLIEHPAIMTHASVPVEQRKAIGIDDGLVRLAVGLEDVDDLIADLAQALNHAAK